MSFKAYSMPYNSVSGYIPAVFGQNAVVYPKLMWIFQGFSTVYLKYEKLNP